MATVNTNSAVPVKGRTKPPSLLACIPCRKSHLKCDGNKPLCRRCSDRNGDCVWIDSRRGYREFRKPQQAKEKREQATNQADPEGGDQDSGGLSGALEADPLMIRQLTFEELYRSSQAFESYDQPGFQLARSRSLAETSSPGSTSGSTVSIARNSSVSKGDETPEDPMDLFYRHFFPAHPFVAPRNLAIQNPSVLPDPVKLTIRYLAGHYVPNVNLDALKDAAKSVFSPDVPEDGYKVQAYLIYGMVCYSRFEQEEGAVILGEAIQLALQLGMNRKEFAIQHGQDDPNIQEMWRRTWWVMFMMECMVTVIGGQGSPFRLYTTFCDVLLPGEDADYEALRASPNPRSLAEMRDRCFADDDFQYSTCAYIIEAAHIMGSVLSLGPDTFAVTDSEVEAIDTSISNFFLSLPPSKREPIRSDGSVDESLVMVHLIINWAAVALHRPRSTLTFIRNHYRTTCTKAEAAGLPALAYASHTAKALRGANAITNLASLQRPLSYATPVLMCGLTTAATVHLPAYAIVDRPDQAVAIKERLALGISALGSFAEVWPRASIAKGQVAKFAREVLTKPNVHVDHTGPQFLPTVSEPVPQLEYDVPFNSESSFWMEDLILAEDATEPIPEACPTFQNFGFELMSRD